MPSSELEPKSLHMSCSVQGDISHTIPGESQELYFDLHHIKAMS